MFVSTYLLASSAAFCSAAFWICACSSAAFWACSAAFCSALAARSIFCCCSFACRSDFDSGLSGIAAPITNETKQTIVLITWE